ncbi:MAG TPA: cation transporter [Bryobacteraceae bacterium]|nr:cation transporter [Bryobacteraceae bacterium]
MKIEILYFDGCPHHRPAVEQVKEALRQEGLNAELVEINVTGAARAQELKFLGSPTIRVNGQDIEPAARSSTSFGLMCRTYMDGGRQTGVPPLKLIREALRNAAGNGQGDEICCAERPARSTSETAPRRSLLMVSAVAAAIAASLCCILPILAAITGLGAIAAGAAFEKWRPYLLGVTGLLLAAGLIFAWRDRKRSCAPGSLCAAKPISRWNWITLGLAAVLAVGLAAFPYYSGAVARMALGAPSPARSAGAGHVSQAAFQIPDLDCPACAVSLSSALRKLPGVLDVSSDVDAHRAVVTYDPTALNARALEDVIAGAGFHPSLEPRS